MQHMDYEYAPLRLPPNVDRMTAAVQLTVAAEYSGWELARVKLFRDGTPFDERSVEAATYLQGTDIEIEVDLGTGGAGRSHMWTCDLSAEYVRINAEYRT